MKFIPLQIPGVFIIQPRVFEDARGFFYESYRKDLFLSAGIRDDFVQDNVSCSQKGVLRGLHYQIEPRSQAKLVRALKGSVMDAVVDIRKDSPTFGKFVVYTLTADSREMMYIPKGFAHGFCALEDGTEFVYKVSDYYSPEHERGILWNDPAIGISWPRMEFILSPKDEKYPTLKEVFRAAPA